MHPALETLGIIRDAIGDGQLDAARQLQAEVDEEWCGWHWHYMRVDAKRLPTPFDVQRARRDRMEASIRRTAIPHSWTRPMGDDVYRHEWRREYLGQWAAPDSD
jgi:hypothetical protein